MAQAPGGGGGAPRQNKTVKQFSGMNTQNQRNAIPEGSFAWLENIQPIGPGNLHSIPGRARNPSTLIPPAGCPDSEPDTQELEVVCCYDNNGFGDLGTNNCGMCAFVNDEGNFWATVSENTGFGSGPYPVATPSQTWYLTEPLQPGGPSCDLVDATSDALTLPGGQTADFQSTQTPQGGLCGPAEERCYLLNLVNINPPIDGTAISNGPGFIGGPINNARAYFGEDTGVTYLFESSNRGFLTNAWAVVGGMLYAANFSFTTPPQQFSAWPLGFPNGTYQTLTVALATMLPGWDDTTFDTLTGILYIHGTTQYLYITVRGPFGGGPTTIRLYRILRSNLTYVTHWVLTGDPNFAAPYGHFAFSDDLIFMVQADSGGSPPGWDIGFFRTGPATTKVIDRVASQCTSAGNPVGPPGQHLFFYQRDTGMYYLSYSGFGLGTTNVLKIGPLRCPSDPDIIFGT